ncbi:hypothetical protein NDU88_002418 [Pleurodeles waltl]|uniref:Uncharacterized protein n=1 Tax=Pleurodeles waltl TaxID=8319 RepID=A0AAV7WL70_PLEWA|nr:hypothetical protein NDU88_002418 [Pleurodeles waltl]
MGCRDPKQHQLSFDATKTPRRQDSVVPHGSDNAERALSAPDPLMEGAAAIMVELKAGFKAIDTRLNSLAMCVDDMHECLDGPSTRVSATEQRISDIEDGSAALTKRVERAEGMLKTGVLKTRTSQQHSHCGGRRVHQHRTHEKECRAAPDQPLPQGLFWPHLHCGESASGH